MTRPQGSKCVHESGVLTWLDRSAGVSAHAEPAAQPSCLMRATCSVDGQYFSSSSGPDTIRQRFDRLAAAAGLSRITFHDLRHSYATGALKAGVSPKVISERLGHANVGFFLQTYAHVLGSDDRDAAEQAAAFLIGNAWEPTGRGGR